jgi:hypothetical protein
VRARIQSGFEDVYQRAMKTGDLSAANNALERLAKLSAAFPLDGPQISINVPAPAVLLHGDPEKDRARLEELRRLDAERKDGGQ